MPRQIIPDSRTGYMVSEDVVHARYADHAPRGPRYRTLDEVFGAVIGRRYSVCGECFPKPEAPRRPASRRAAQVVAEFAAEHPELVETAYAVPDAGSGEGDGPQA
ncbi:MAG: hypothetical protein IT341_10580 [Chloroflexi bacterium]|nr:hypothetical protein [Chloroflexota bacterium]